jgi:asparagine synthase (glutamine-hydrolysing)
MCAIAGYVLSDAAGLAPAIRAVDRMTSRMHSRGPDAGGQWTGDRVVLGHRRLAILDLDSRANQPMTSTDGRYVIAFNGEIYNYAALRDELRAAGIRFCTASDTEVLLKLYERDGPRMLDSLRGMFAIAIWDTRRNELFLARDPYGIKPLYYAVVENGLIFASQVKALLASGVVSREPEAAGLAGFYLWGSVPEPWTLSRGVFALPAGHWLIWRDGVTQPPACWHDIRRHWQSEADRESPRELAGAVRQAITESVRAHLVSDVPISVLLSGGIDSAVIAAIAASLGARIEGITIAFDEFAGGPEDEAPMAALIAAHYGLSHSVRRVSRAEFEADLPQILDAMDQPSVDGLNTWFASKAVAERGFKVVLSGLGGDELFGGYASFNNIPRAAAFARVFARVPGARALLRAPFLYLARKRSQPKLAGAFKWMDSVEDLYFLQRGLFLPQELGSVMAPELAAQGLARLQISAPLGSRVEARDDRSTIGLLESTQYLRNQLLRDSDWASMAHSLELRTPFVDVPLLTRLGPSVHAFGNGRGKALLAGSPIRPLPAAVVRRSKSGFGIPMAKWLPRGFESGAQTRAADTEGSPWARQWATLITESGR